MKNIYEAKKNKEDNKERPKPALFNIEDIQCILKKNKYQKKTKKIIDNLSLDFIRINEESEKNFVFTNKKRKRYLSIFQEDDENKDELIKDKKADEEPNKLTRGRKSNITGKHNKMSPDNIIKKIKAKIFVEFIKFLNNLLKKPGEEEDKLLKLNYQFVNRLKREVDLKYLNSSLKNLASKEISPKYTTKLEDTDFNKKYIKKLLKKEKDKTILFAFNMTLRDWLDLFCLKKSVEQLINDYNYKNKEIDCERIRNSLDGVESLLNGINENNCSEYLSACIFYLYNYERWFYVKKGRNNKKVK